MQNKRRTLVERARLVAAYRSSGLKQGQFAEREGISVSALQNWLYSAKHKLAREAPTGAFVRVVGSQPLPGGGVTVRIGDSVAIVFEALPDATYLADLARAMAC